MQKLGINKTSEAGISQLRERISQIKSEILSPSFDIKTLLNTELHAQYFKSYIRFYSSEWSRASNQELFSELIETHSKNQESGELRPLPPEFQPSGEVRIDKIDRESQESFEYSEQFLSRYETLRHSLKDTMNLLDNKRSLASLLAKAERKRAEILKDLDEKLETLSNPKAKQNLEKRIGDLREINLRSVKDFQNKFTTLSQFGDFDDSLTQLLFLYALKKNKYLQEQARGLIEKDTPSFTDVSSMVNFVEHVANKETWSQYFTDKKAIKEFRKITKINALEEELTRAQNQKIIGTTSLEFIPTRGLLMEFSGHIADACWASKYYSISEAFPNMSSVIMAQNRGTKHERLSGASMLIETESREGVPLLVIRGLNPVENLINSLAVEDFFEKYTAYAREIAEKSGRKLAIAIDGRPGGSCTNRPVLHEFLKAKRDSLERVILNSRDDTTFNDYGIVNKTFLL